MKEIRIAARWYVFEMKGKKGKKVHSRGKKVEERIE